MSATILEQTAPPAAVEPEVITPEQIARDAHRLRQFLASNRTISLAPDQFARYLGMSEARALRALGELASHPRPPIRRAFDRANAWTNHGLRR